MAKYIIPIPPISFERSLEIVSLVNNLFDALESGSLNIDQVTQMIEQVASRDV